MNVLVTHGPPRVHVDLMDPSCYYLLKEVRRLRPRLRVSGHVQDGHGSEFFGYDAPQRACEQVVMDVGLGRLIIVLKMDTGSSEGVLERPEGHWAISSMCLRSVGFRKTERRDTVGVVM